MVDNSFLQGAGSAHPISNPVSAPGAVGAGGAPTAESAAFRALLEKLETQAKDLARVSEEVENPVELAGAVDSAKESLTDALSLRDRLFEAYRAAHQSSTFPSTDEQGS